MNTKYQIEQYKRLRKQIIRSYSIDVWMDAKEIVSPSDWRSEETWEEWVEISPHRPGDVYEHPHLVFCTQDDALGSVPARIYKPIS